MKKNSNDLRYYRKFMEINNRFCYFRSKYKEIDLFISINPAIDIYNTKIIINSYIKLLYNKILSYALYHNNFLHSLKPIKVLMNDPEIIKNMKIAGIKANVGPMASVAGIISYYVCKKLKSMGYDEVIVENGGDITLFVLKPVNILINAGKSELSNKLSVNLPITNKFYSVSTSSGKIGHSKNFGNADAVSIFSEDSGFSDAYATYLSNKFKSINDFEKFSKDPKIPDTIDQIIVIYNNKLLVKGKFKIDFLKEPVNETN